MCIVIILFFSLLCFIELLYECVLLIRHPLKHPLDNDRFDAFRGCLKVCLAIQLQRVTNAGNQVMGLVLCLGFCSLGIHKD